MCQVGEEEHEHGSLPGGDIYPKVFIYPKVEIEIIQSWHWGIERLTSLDH